MKKTIKKILRENDFDWVNDVKPANDLEELKHYLETNTDLKLIDLDDGEWDFVEKTTPNTRTTGGGWEQVEFGEKDNLITTGNINLPRVFANVADFQVSPEAIEYVNSIYEQIYDALTTLFPENYKYITEPLNENDFDWVNNVPSSHLLKGTKLQTSGGNILMFDRIGGNQYGGEDIVFFDDEHGEPYGTLRLDTYLDQIEKGEWYPIDEPLNEGNFDWVNKIRPIYPEIESEYRVDPDDMTPNIVSYIRVEGIDEDEDTIEMSQNDYFVDSGDWIGQDFIEITTDDFIRYVSNGRYIEVDDTGTEINENFDWVNDIEPTFIVIDHRSRPAGLSEGEWLMFELTFEDEDVYYKTAGASLKNGWDGKCSGKVELEYYEDELLGNYWHIVDGAPEQEYSDAHYQSCVGGDEGLNEGEFDWVDDVPEATLDVSELESGKTYEFVPDLSPMEIYGFEEIPSWVDGYDGTMFYVLKNGESDHGINGQITFRPIGKGEKMVFDGRYTTLPYDARIFLWGTFREVNNPEMETQLTEDDFVWVNNIIPDDLFIGATFNREDDIKITITDVRETTVEYFTDGGWMDGRTYSLSKDRFRNMIRRDSLTPINEDDHIKIDY